MNLYKEYADVKLIISSAEARLEELKVKLLADLSKKDGNKEETDFGVFSIRRKNNWKYSAKLKKLKDDIKLKEIDEQEKGIAEVEVTEYISYKENATDL